MTSSGNLSPGTVSPFVAPSVDESNKISEEFKEGYDRRQRERLAKQSQRKACEQSDRDSQQSQAAASSAASSSLPPQQPQRGRREIHPQEREWEQRITAGSAARQPSLTEVTAARMATRTQEQNLRDLERLAERGQRKSQFEINYVKCNRQFCIRTAWNGDPDDYCCKLCRDKNPFLEHSATTWGEARSDGYKEKHGPGCNVRYLGDDETVGEWKLIEDFIKGERSDR